MQCKKVSYLLLQNGDNHTQVHHLAGVLLRTPADLTSEMKGSFCQDKFLQDPC